MQYEVAPVIEEVEIFMATVDDALPLPRIAAEFVHFLVLATGAQRVVEIGTSYGYSGLWIASALAETSGTLITVDHEERKSGAARQYFESAGLGGRIEIQTGKAEHVLKSITGPIDFVLNDADKENCIRYVELLADKLADRAVILTDNIDTHRAQLAEFIEWIDLHPNFESVSLPLGNGMEFSVHHKGGVRR
ncbi:MAG: class I SAM-dependent methyltransferase [Phycisphaerae bacterium]